MVYETSEHPWPSYQYNALGVSDPALTSRGLYCDLGNSDEARLTAYRRPFQDELSAALLQRLRDCRNVGCVLGSPRFELPDPEPACGRLRGSSKADKKRGQCTGSGAQFVGMPQGLAPFFGVGCWC